MVGQVLSLFKPFLKGVRMQHTFEQIYKATFQKTSVANKEKRQEIQVI